MLTQLAFVVAFFVTSRYRLPALPLAAILATGLCARVFAAIRTRGRAWTQQAIAAGGATAVLVVASNWPLEHESFARSAIEEYDVGDALAHDGKGGEAIAHLRAAVAIAPRFADAHVYLGYLLQGAGSLEQAVAEYRIALEIEPDNALAKKDLESLAEHARPGTVPAEARVK
jgi:tetratricopeptide (TPR) repeat protein